MSNDMIRISAEMKRLGIESIRYSPPDGFIPRDTYTVRLLDGWMPSDIGCGDTVREAYLDAVAKVRAKAAA